METKSLTARHLSEAEAALSDIEKQRSLLLEEIAHLREILAKRATNGLHQPQTHVELQSEQPDERHEPRYGSKRHRIETALEKLLRENGELHRLHLCERLKEMNVIGNEYNPLANLSNVLSTSPKFEPVKSGIWRLAQTELETKTAG
jgi:hypothetical protein